MYLQDIFDQLSIGEFKQLSIGGQLAGVIDENNWSSLIGHVNLALTALYTRFNLKEERLTLRMAAANYVYPLTSYYAVSARRGAAVRHVIDTLAVPFVDDVIKIERVVAVNTDEQEFALNDTNNVYSITTPSVATLRIPADIVDQASDLPSQYLTTDLTVIYRAKHEKIIQGLGYFDPTRTTIELPETHLSALLYYVAGRVHNPIGLQNEFNAANNYMARYEAECQMLEGRGIQVVENGSGGRLSRGGWV